MTESVYNWMQMHEKRLNNPQKPQKRNDTSRSVGILHYLPASTRKIENTQKTIDGYISKKETTLFDESFSKADFELLTLRWKEKHLEEIPVN